MQLHLTARKQCTWGVFPLSWPCRTKQEHSASLASKNFSQRWEPKRSHRTIICLCSILPAIKLFFAKLKQIKSSDTTATTEEQILCDFLTPVLIFPSSEGTVLGLLWLALCEKPQKVFKAFRTALCLILAQPLCQYWESCDVKLTVVFAAITFANIYSRKRSGRWLPMSHW